MENNASLAQRLLDVCLVGRGRYSIFLELRSPLVRVIPILDLSFLGPSGPHGALKVTFRLIKPNKNAGFGVWGPGSGFPPNPFISPLKGM